MSYVANTMLILDGEFVKAEPFTPSSIHPILRSRYRKLKDLTGQLTAVIACPACGKYSHVGPKHDPRTWERRGIAAVIHMVECPHPGCDFHGNVALMAWHEEKP